MSTPDPADTFRQEARDLLESLEQALLDLEQAPDDRELVDSVFRSLHTLKGSGAMFGFDEVADFVHEFETAFDRVRKGESSVTPALIAVALSAGDHVGKLIEEPGRHAAQGEPILAALHDIVGDRGAVKSTSVPAPSDGARQARTWRVRFRLPDDALALGTNPLLLLDELRELGECKVEALADDVPPLEEIDPQVCYFAWDVTLTTEAPREAIEDVFMFLRDGMALEIESLEAGENDGPSNTDEVSSMPTKAAAQGETQVQGAGRQGAPATKAGKGHSSSLRVPAERLDELMDRVGELVIAQARLSQITGASDDLELKTVAEEIERLSSGLRDITMGIRMVPIGTLFGRFRRLVHDLSHELGKEVEFVASGEETELDKTVIEQLADPLVHLIRNAVDHGLEDPERRQRAGKSRGGKVRLAAVHSGAEVAISIRDDGAGLDAERIRAKAESAGLIAPDAKLSDHELFQYIFHPGFSTASEVTSVSGRGVGMDAVKRTIEALRGSIELASEPGSGTTVTLHLPLTLAIIDGMLVRVGEGRYCLPLLAVEECVELPEAEITEAQGRNFLNIRGSLVPFLRLRELFAAGGEPDPHQKVVVVSSGESRVGLVVDQIIGNNQTVIKPLSRLHADLGTFSGATILGDGSVALILDITHLVSFGRGFEQRLRDERMRREA
ncbi:chemotaxis protein CheA [Litchfieldella qijiaojingensis]|uniref:Chemotaxis protein CheA n=1 Tax=Litchfieldella qijiaojingensis TaxID=980347 RepID=A0ABQ2ZD68_9GAMM|nr:chemotaxis protein CheA [Halomonas qijiaojingensis]GGY08744.1 chemotaxis protein CheA [Halomonas qijiaojingensis]